MQGPLLAEFQRRRFSIRSRWDALLRTEPVTSPLAHPDALVHLLDSTIEDIFSALRARALRTHPPAPRTPPPQCACGRNPLVTYFAAGRQALREGLVLSQAALAPFDPVQRDRSLAVLEEVLDALSRREIETFCGVCQFRAALSAHPVPATLTTV